MCKILLVDDEYLERKALRVIISKNIDYAEVIGETALGREAVKLSEVLNPDIIFMDIKIPGMDGVEASRIIKERSPEQRIIILTAYDEFEFAQKAVKANVDDYVLKPVKNKKIVKLVNEHYKKSFMNDNRDRRLENNLDTYMEHAMTKELLKAIRYVQKNFHKRINLKDVAKHVNLSVSYLSRIFKEELGINFTTYIRNCRMGKAKELLESTDMPIINISLELGYNESNYFSKVFKEEFDMTPSEYRNNIKETKIKKLKSNPFVKHTPLINGRWYI